VPKSEPEVVFINARTCGIYKNGGPRLKTDQSTGKRTEERDDELSDLVDKFLAGKSDPGITRVPVAETERLKVLVPTYYDRRYASAFEETITRLGWGEVTLGELLDSGVVTLRYGHGSPGNDQRAGSIPYIKVSDIRALRVNVNPTNLVPRSVAERFWRGKSSGLSEFDLITPNRASSNIGEFAILLPGEEDVVVTREVFVLRVAESQTHVWDPFTLFWALCLKAVREQWRRIALMQTNREDCGERFREIRLPLPPSREVALQASAAFRSYFKAIAKAKSQFLGAIEGDANPYIASVTSAIPADEANAEAPADSSES
jgi:type I restriction enzyme M protein